MNGLGIRFAIPGDLTAPTGGYAYARRVLVEWSGQGIAAKAASLPDGFPYPSQDALQRTEAILRAGDGPLLIDGLAYGAFPEPLAVEIGPGAAILLHHPLCDEQGLSSETAEAMRITEKAALAHARAVIVTSPATARDVMRRFDVPQAKLTVAIPGNDTAPQAALSGDPPRILAVGTVSPRKGYDLLVDALATCRSLPWRCEIFGATDRDVSEVARIETRIANAGLADRIVLKGAAAEDALAAAYLGADLFVAPSRHEGYGMAVVEAMAHGLPVIASRAGALAETASCARLVPVNDTPALAAALGELLADPDARLALGAECRRYASSLPGWSETARRIARAIEAAF